MRQRVFILWLKSSWSKLNSKIEIRGNNPQSLEKLQNPVNPTKKTTGNIGVGSFFSTCWFDAIVKTHDFVILKNHHLSSCVFFRGSLPQSEAAARSMWSKPRNTSAQKFQQKTKEIVQVAILTCVTWLWSVLFFSDFLVWLPFWHFSFGALTLDHFFCGVRVCLVCYF